MVIIPLCLLLFGIITFGLVMAFKQNLVQAASEGARAGAVAPTGQATTAAYGAADAAVREFRTGGCGATGVTCTVSPPATCPTVAGRQCITVRVDYDYEHHPLLTLPFVGAFIPNTLTATSSAQVNP